MTILEAYALYERNVMRRERFSAKTYRNYATFIKKITESIGNVDMQWLGPEHIDKWRTDMEDRACSNSYISSEYSKLRSILKFLQDNTYEVMDYHKVKLLPRDTKPREWLQAGEVKQIIEGATNARDRAIIALMFSTGCRPFEFLALNKDVLELEEIWVKGKGDQYRQIYIDQKARGYIQDYLDTRKSDPFEPLFISGQRRRITLSRVEQIVHECTARSGVDKVVTPYVFRHSFISDLGINGAPIGATQKLAGHKRASTTLDVYTHVRDKEAASVYEQFHTK